MESKTTFNVNRIKYRVVRGIWKIIDGLTDWNANKAILMKEIKIEENIPYVIDGIQGHLLDVYYPENIVNKLPVIIYTHGGGFIAGDKRQTKQYCMTLAKEGYVVFNINYSLAPYSIHPTQILDFFAAIAWIKENSITYHGDENRVVLAGDSAGAYLTGLAACIITNDDLATRFEVQQPFTEKQIMGVMLFSGLYDLETAYNSGFPSIKSDIEMFLGISDINGHRNIGHLSVVKNITESFPNTFISSGEVDRLYSESLKLIEILEGYNIYCEKLLFDKTEKKSQHNYQLHMHLDISKQCMSRVTQFLERITKKDGR